MATFKSKLIFDVLKNILGTKSIEVYNYHIGSNEFSTVSKFMVLRYLSMSPSEQVRSVVLDNYISLERMPEKVLYKWLIDNIPYQKNTFITYIR